jgi:hypothetical protein
MSVDNAAPPGAAAKSAAPTTEPATGGAPAATEAAAPESVLVPEAAGAGRLEAAIAAFNAARSSAPETPDAPAPVTDAAPAKPGETAASSEAAPPVAGGGSTAPAAAPATDPRFDEVLGRLTKSEQRILEAEQRAKAAEAKTAEYEALFAASEEEPDKLFDRIKWKPEKVREYAEKGKKALSPELARLTQLVEQQSAEIAALKTETKQQSAERTVREYKAELGRDYAPLADKYPHLTAAYDGDQAQIVEQLFATIETAYDKGRGKLLTTQEAAHAIDAYWERIAKKFAPKQSSAEATPTATQSPKPSAATAKPPAPPPDDDGDAMSPDDRRFAASLAAFRATRRETA